jgi:hypothetical protein
MLPLLAAALLAPAATIGLEGTELVYRSGPAQNDTITFQNNEGVLFGPASGIAPGAGCERVEERIRCPLAGVTAIRVFAGDGDDSVILILDEHPAIVDLGPGDDGFRGRAPVLTLSGGDGFDYAESSASAGTLDLGPGDDVIDSDIGGESTGPLLLAGGDGRDRISFFGDSDADISISGGPGDDTIAADAFRGQRGVTVACGPGDDRTTLHLRDRPGDGCAAHPAFGAPGRVSRSLAVSLSAPATGSVTFRRRPGNGRRPAETIARGSFTAGAPGPLRVRLKTTKAGRRWLRSDRDLKLYVFVRTRTGGDRGEVRFDSRIAARTRSAQRALIHRR